MKDAEFLPEFGVGWTIVGMVGAGEVDNAMVRILFILIVTTGWRGHK